MEYSKQELKEIEELKKKHPIVEKLWVEHELYNEDVAHILLFEFKETSRDIAADLRLVRKGESEHCTIISSKYFEIISDLLIKGDKIFSMLKKGKEVVDPEGAAKDKKTTEEENEVVF